MNSEKNDRKDKPLRERDLLAQVKDYLKIKGVFFFRIHQSLGSTPGLPDIIAVQPGTGRLIGLELKSDRGKLSYEQIAFQQAAEKAGALAGTVRCIEDVDYLLARV